MNILRHNPYLFTLMDLIFLYKEFANIVIGNVTYLMDLFTNLYLTNVNFKIIICFSVKRIKNDLCFSH